MSHETQKSPVQEEYPLVEYRTFKKDGLMVAVFRVKDAFGERDVLYTKENLEIRIKNLKKNGQPYAQAELALTNWPAK